MNAPAPRRIALRSAYSLALVAIGAAAGIALERHAASRTGSGRGGSWQFHEWGGGIMLFQPATGRMLHWAGAWIEFTPQQLGGRGIYVGAPPAKPPDK